MCTKGNRLLARSALTVDGDAGHLLRVTRREPGQSADVAGLSTDRVDTADDRVVDGGRIDIVAVEDAAERVDPEVDRVNPGQRAVALADGGTNGVDDVRLGHVLISSVVVIEVSCQSAAIPPRTMARYCLPTCSAVIGPPG